MNLPRLRISVLGPFQVALDARPITGITSPKIQALLAYLALQPDRAHSRDALAELLWPDLTPGNATKNLRQSLYRLNRAIAVPAAAPDFLLIDRHSVRVNPDSGWSSDVADFGKALAFVEAHRHRLLEHCRPCGTRLTAAIPLYRGDFLQDVIAESASYEEWALLQREWFHRQVLAALAHLAAHSLWLGDNTAAHRLAWRQVELEPWREEGHRQVMRALAAMGRRGEALSQYDELCRILEEELGVAPASESTSLAEDIRTGHFTVITATHPRRHPLALSPQQTPFIGRETELANIAGHLDDPHCHLLTLVGPGGIGKSRLAVQTALEKGDEFPHGACVVALADVRAAPELVTAILQALGIAFSPEQQGEDYLRSRLLDVLQRREMLLVFDNYEQLLPETELVVAILQRAPQVKLLVTSRERLRLRAEWLLDIPGLPYPEPAVADGPFADGRDATAFAAVRLFVENVRRLRVDFALSPNTAPAVVEICRLVAGMPLALELAAAWARTMPVSEIAAEIAQNIDFLSTTMADADPRHRSLRAVFAHSWRLLSLTEKEALSQLSIFQGGFTAAAAAAVAEADAATLRALVDRSLLQQATGDRYDFHELLHAYAGEKLAAGAHEDPFPGKDAVANRHCDFYIGLLEGMPEVWRPEGEETLPALAHEIANVRTAWEWAVAKGRLAQLERGMVGLARFYAHYGLLREGQAALAAAVDRVRALQATDPSADGQPLLARLLVEQLRFLYELARYDELVAAAREICDLTPAQPGAGLRAQATLHWAAAHMRRGSYPEAAGLIADARALAQTAGLLRVEADGYRLAGQIAVRQGDYPAASQSYQESLRLSRQARYLWGEAHALGGLGNVRLVQEQPLQARGQYEQAVALFERVGDQVGQTTYLDNLGTSYWALGDYTHATVWYRRSLSIRREIGDRRGEGASLLRLAIQRHYQGDFAAGRRGYEQALDIYREIGYRRGEGEALAHLCLLHHQQGAHEAALQEGEQAVIIARETSDRSDLGYALNFLGGPLLALGRSAEAGAAYAESLTLRQEIGEYNRAMEPLAGLAEVELSLGNLAEAGRCADGIRGHLERGSLDVTDEPIRVYLACYRVLRATDNPAAPAILAAGRELLNERAALITDKNLRRSFLEDLPAHRALLAQTPPE